MDFDLSHYALTNENAGGNSSPCGDVDSKGAMKATLASNLLGEDAAGGFRVLALTEKAPAAPEGYTSSMKVLYTQSACDGGARKARTARHILTAPERILDAPDLVDDYYLNLLDWSASNLLAVALGQTVYLWNAATGTIDELMETKGECIFVCVAVWLCPVCIRSPVNRPLCVCVGADDFVTSVSWVKDGSSQHLAIGTNLAEVQLWDVTKSKQVRPPCHAFFVCACVCVHVCVCVCVCACLCVQFDGA